MKRYRKEEWARLTPAERLAAVGLRESEVVWCEVLQSYERLPPTWYASAGYDTTTHPYHHDLDLGWTCSNWDTSSDFSGVPSWSVFPVHKCAVDVGMTNALFALVMSGMVGLIVWMALR